ncbi:MAG: hypothetical protein HW386_2002 [Gammaproteobacteria bacterium]|nr:hypothetical protein [Gammaproteobacteria bacterium]
MTHKCYTLWFVVTLSAFTSMSVIAEGSESNGTWQGLKLMMSSEEFRAAGLDKLSTDELQQLDAWLVRFLAHDAQQVVHTDETIQELQKVPVQRRIAGRFTGWRGETVFQLDNGEVWKQRLSGRYAVVLENPLVEISRNLFGYYELRVVETGVKIGVTRLK